MNSDHVPTAHELPPVPNKERAMPWLEYWRDVVVSERERQLRASIQSAANLESQLAIARDLIRELEKALQAQAQGAASQAYRNVELADRAEAAEAKLRAVSDALGPKPDARMRRAWSIGEEHRDVILDRIRAIVEGK